METVIFDVKMLLSQNNAPSDAFFLGALKHRDLRGQEVSSQVKRRQVNFKCAQVLIIVNALLDTTRVP